MNQDRVLSFSAILNQQQELDLEVLAKIDSTTKVIVCTLHLTPSEALDLANLLFHALRETRE